jgi:DNA-binding transcriptional ArsR family regulator
VSARPDITIYSTHQLTNRGKARIINYMVEHLFPPALLPAQLDAVFHALADPTRRAMVQRLAQSACTVSELARPFAMSLAAASKHLRVLEGAGLIDRRVEGRQHFCSLDATALRSAQDWLRYYEQYWSESFDALDRIATQEPHP